MQLGSCVGIPDAFNRLAPISLLVVFGLTACKADRRELMRTRRIFTGGREHATLSCNFAPRRAASQTRFTQAAC